MKTTLYLLSLLLIGACCGFESPPGIAGTDADASTGDAGPDASSSSTGDASSSSSTGGESSSESSSGDQVSATDDTGSSSTGDASSSSGDASCLGNADCPNNGVCSDSECVDAWAVPHAVRVTAWDEPCNGAGTNMFFVAVGAFESESVTCPQGWPDDWFTVAAGGAAVAFDFFELGGAPNPDQLVTSWCWDQGMGCGPVPKHVLHAGTVDVAWGDWTATFEFQVVE